jgi:prevent-host-death family protein
MMTTIMATMAIGVRELKAHAPALVKRAANGERIVITRYGKPHAQLGPVEEIQGQDRPAPPPRMAAWQAERLAFERQLPRLKHRYNDRYVAVYGGKVVGSDADPDVLFERLWHKLHGRTFFIGRVGGPPPVVEMPGFEVE